MKAYSMRRIAVVCALLLSIVASTASATVSLSVTLFNSESSVQENVNVENANYAASAILLPYSGFADFPYSILSGGSGKSTTGSESKFTHSVSAQGPGGDSSNMEASVETESGAFAWSKSLTASDSVSMGMGVSSQVWNGNLDASYSNSGSAESKEISTERGVYADRSYITPQLIRSVGSGASTNEIDNAFFSRIEAQNLGKIAVMDSGLDEISDVEGADNKWADSVKLDPSGASLAASLSVLSNNERELLPMVGIAAGPIIAGMRFTSHYSSTGDDIFEMKTVPKSDGLISFRTIDRTLPASMATYESATLSMTAKWR